MLMEAWAIILLLLVMAGIFFRVRKIDYAIMTLPLGTVPAARILSGPIAAAVRGLGVPAEMPLLRCCVILFGLIAASVLIIGLSKNAPSTRARRGYVIVCILFSFCIAWVFAGDVLVL